MEVIIIIDINQLHLEVLSFVLLCEGSCSLPPLESSPLQEVLFIVMW